MDTSFLFELLSQPTAPFREGLVVKAAVDFLDRAKVPWFQDPVGNLVVGVGSQKDYLARVRQRTDEPLRLFIAHMDHPGFHGARWTSSRELEIEWHGGSPRKHLNGADV